MNIDAHQHFWKYSQKDYPWITSGMERLARDYLPPELVQTSQLHNISGSVAVQARQTKEETQWLLQCADSHSSIRGVVGWVDLRSPSVGDDLSHFSQHKKFVGVRHVVQDEPDPHFLLGAEFLRGLRQLTDFDLTYDLLVFPHQLPAAVELVRLLPDQSFVLDHMAKPQIRKHETEDWEQNFSELARHENVMCKLSGLVTEADWKVWQQEDFTPYLEIALDAFGPDRLMFGSDWPVCLLSAEYAEVLGIAHSLIDQLSLDEAAAITGSNAENFYGLVPD
ncbi:amidohydrolase family protein [Pirellulales bacterium]|jgi:L-fuconolactonase|nr:amidohydrolase family protein [Pirellulales bacterium]MDA7898936.1 amidohydrolase family protein [Pirellulales bacterium]MDB4358309.1 amidohydrolase family protein [bacterium]